MKSSVHNDDAMVHATTKWYIKNVHKGS